MDEHVAIVLRGGPLDGRQDALVVLRQPRYFDTPSGGWALYTATELHEDHRVVFRFQHGSDLDDADYTRSA